MTRFTAVAAGLLAALALAGCAPGLITPGGAASGIPDTVMGDWRDNMTSGSISTDGVITTRRDGPLIGPGSRGY